MTTSFNLICFQGPATTTRYSTKIFTEPTATTKHGGQGTLFLICFALQDTELSCVLN